MARIFKPAMGTGDNGFTALLNGKRVKKTDPRIKTNALIDELSSLLGYIKIRTGKSKTPLKIRIPVEKLQKTLMAVSAGIAGADTAWQIKSGTGSIEHEIKRLSRSCAPSKEFVLPGGSEIEALLHLARTKARICEILVWELKNAKPGAICLNRLSDYLFLLALKARSE